MTEGLMCPFRSSTQESDKVMSFLCTQPGGKVEKCWYGSPEAPMLPAFKADTKANQFSCTQEDTEISSERPIGIKTFCYWETEDKYIDI